MPIFVEGGMEYKVKKLVRSHHQNMKRKHVGKKTIEKSKHKSVNVRCKSDFRLDLIRCVFIAL